MIVQVLIRPKPDVFDPAGEQVKDALERLGFKGLNRCTVGRMVLLELDTNDPEEARELATRMAMSLLANPVSEDFEVRTIS